MKLKKVSSISEKVFTLLSTKKPKITLTEIGKRIKVSRQTVFNHVIVLINKGYLTPKRNPTIAGKKRFTLLSYTPRKEKKSVNPLLHNKVHVHKLQIYSKIIKVPYKWNNNREFYQDIYKYNEWTIKNNKITEFYIQGLRTRVTTKKVIFYFTNLKASSVVMAKTHIFKELFSIKKWFEKVHRVTLSSNFFVTEQEIANQADQVAAIVNAAKTKGKITGDGRFILEIFDRKKEKRAHVDLSELDELETTHSRHAEDDMDGYLNHMTDAKKNNIKKQLKDWMFDNPPTLSYQYKKIKAMAIRIESLDDAILKLEAVTRKTVEASARAAEASFVLSEKIVEAFKR